MNKYILLILVLFFLLPISCDTKQEQPEVDTDSFRKTFYRQWRNVCIYNDSPPIFCENIGKDAYAFVLNKWTKLNGDLIGVTIRLKGMYINEIETEEAPEDGFYYIFYVKDSLIGAFLYHVDDVILKEPSPSNPKYIDEADLEN